MLSLELFEQIVHWVAPHRLGAHQHHMSQHSMRCEDAPALFTKEKTSFECKSNSKLNYNARFNFTLLNKLSIKVSINPRFSDLPLLCHIFLSLKLSPLMAALQLASLQHHVPWQNALI